MVDWRKRIRPGVLVVAGLLAIFLTSAFSRLSAQATTATGSIQGAVSDPTGAAVPHAKITIGDAATGQTTHLTASSTGVYSSGPLLPGSYTLRVQAAGFKTYETTLVVQVGVITPGNFALQVGAANTVVKVTGAMIAPNTTEATVQGVLGLQQIQNLPINGGNYLDLAQLEPGVQIQDGGNFDPTKNGFSSISFGGRFGRTARIEVDGVDISDETVGTTTQNIPLAAIQEFQTEQSTLSPSTELTSSGAVNVVTRSGTDSFHGSFFFNGRSDQLAARIAPEPLAFSRKHYGADLGGYLVKDKLFFFGSWERIQQDLQDPVTLADPFSALSSFFNSPFRDSLYMTRLDWKIKPNWSAFYRFSYEQNRNARGFIPNTFQPFENVNNTPVHVAGLDFITGKFTHSVRFGWTKYRNGIGDAVAESGALNPAPGLEVAIGPDFTCIFVAGAFCSGTNFLVPQKTFQRDIQGKYDGSYIFRSHTLIYGFAVNAIKDGGFAAFLANAPAVNVPFDSSTEAAAASGPFPNGASNPLNYAISAVVLGNGQGGSTDTPAFGLPSGGRYDNRIEWYVGDSWKARPSLVITGTLRYVRDTGRTDSDLAPIAALTEFGNSIGLSNLGRAPNQPNKDFGGMLGIAWAPFGPKTVFRVGTGIYYENAIFNNILFDAPGRLSKGLFLGFDSLTCPIAGNAVTLPNGQVFPVSFCGQPLGTSAAQSQIIALQKAFQAATAQVGPSANPIYFGNALADNPFVIGTGLISPKYRTPYSWQLNAGVQQELWRGTVLSLDYLRNVGLHYLVGVDVNNTGDSRFLNMAGAQAAISATNSAFGCGTGFDQGSINCAIAAGATIGNYAGNGLGAPYYVAGGFPCAPPGCAFGGKNPSFGQVQLYEPIGRSVFNALQVELRGQVTEPKGLSSAGFMRHAQYVISYQLSQFDSLFQDQDFINAALDNRNPLRFFGPNSLDRTDQLSAGGFWSMWLGTQIGIITHWDSNFPTNLLLPCTGTAADTFQFDWLGSGPSVGASGLTCSPLPGTNIGSFGRGVRLSNLNSVIGNYNSTFAGQFTPAGQALINAQLFTPTELQQLDAVMPSIPLAPPGQVGISSLFTFDLMLSWDLHLAKLSRHLPESLTLRPTATIYNLFNRQNFDPPTTLPSFGILNGLPGSVNGTTKSQRTDLINLGSGTFALGAPREIVLGARLSF